MDDHELNPLARQFPSNAITKKQEEPRKKLQPVVSEPVQLKKKGFLTRMKEAIFSDDSGSIGGYVMKDIIIPTVRDTMYDIVTGALSMALYSTPKSARKKNSGTGTYISYADYYNDSRVPAKKIPVADRHRTKFDLRNIPIPSSEVGYDAIEQLKDRYEAYGNVSAQDLFDVLMIGSVPSTMARLGWEDISPIRVECERGQWYLRTPPMKQL